MPPIYLDYAATMPVAPEVADWMMQYLTADGIFTNPSSIQQCFGEQAELTVENARSSTTNLLNCKPKDSTTTSFQQPIYDTFLLLTSFRKEIGSLGFSRSKLKLSNEINCILLLISS